MSVTSVAPSFAATPSGHSATGVIRMAALAAGGVGLLALFGWIADVPHLKSVFPGAVEMKANTALGLLAAACSLWLLAGKASGLARGWGTSLGLLVASLGFLTLAQYLLSTDLGIDQFFFADTAGAFNAIKGRMSPYSAAAFASIGAALALLGLRRAPAIAYLLAAVPLLIGAVAAIGYGWNAVELTSDALLPPVAVNTAVALMLLGGGTTMAIWTGLRQRRWGARETAFAMSWVESKIMIAFLASLLLLLVAGGLVYKAGEDFSESAKRVAHTQRVRATLRELEEHLFKAGLAQRTYVITGARGQLEEYGNRLSSVSELENELAGLVADDPRQLERLALLRLLAGQLRSALNTTAQTYWASGFAAAQTLILDGLSNDQFASISSIVRRMDATEDRRLRDREAVTINYKRQMLLALLATILVSTAMFAFLFNTIRRHMQARARTDVELANASAVVEQSRQDADAANRAKSSFLAAMSHEIRTPMNGVLGLLELLSLTKLDADQRSSLSVVRDSSRSLLRIVDDILDFSKIEANKLEIHPEPGSVQEVVDSVCRVYRSLASSKGISLHGRVDTQVGPSHLFDSVRLQQILNNFVSNAIKFTERGSVELDVKRVEASAAAETLRFTVTDTGIGITPDKLARLFQPFTQGDAETGTRYGGTGLGLVIARRIAGLMGGIADIESIAGVGTTSSLVLTFDVVQAQTAGHERKAADGIEINLLRLMREPPSFEAAERDGTLLLVVDDHATNRLVLQRQLNSLGYAVKVAADGRQALDAIKAHAFGAILTDCNMPEMSGYELAREVRRLEQQHPAGRRLPILACTANAMPAEAAICTEAGMDDYLIKPVSLTKLSRSLADWVPLQEMAAPSSPGPAADRKERRGDMIDHSLLDSISGSDPQDQQAILAEFRRLNDEDAAQLRVYIAARDLDGVKHFSHRIRGSCAMLGAVGLEEVCRLIEEASRAGDAAALTPLAEAFELQVDLLNRYLNGLESAAATGARGSATPTVELN